MRHVRSAVCVLALLGVALPARAVTPMSQDEAMRAAVRLLKGTDYGASIIEIMGHIKEKQLIRTGSNACGTLAAPVWAFHLVRPYDGWLYLDAASGEKQCSTLPFMR